MSGWLTITAPRRRPFFKRVSVALRRLLGRLI